MMLLGKDFRQLVNGAPVGCIVWRDCHLQKKYKGLILLSDFKTSKIWRFCYINVLQPFSRLGTYETLMLLGRTETFQIVQLE